MEQINQKFIYNVYSLYEPISNSREHFCVSACYLCKEVNFHLFNANTHTRQTLQAYTELASWQLCGNKKISWHNCTINRVLPPQNSLQHIALDKEENTESEIFLLQVSKLFYLYEWFNCDLILLDIYDNLVFQAEKLRRDFFLKHRLMKSTLCAGRTKPALEDITS